VFTGHKSAAILIAIFVVTLYIKALKLNISLFVKTINPVSLNFKLVFSHFICLTLFMKRDWATLNFRKVCIHGCFARFLLIHCTFRNVIAIQVISFKKNKIKGAGRNTFMTGPFIILQRRLMDKVPREIQNGILNCRKYT
jgi:hypothetical protein